MRTTVLSVLLKRDHGTVPACADAIGLCSKTLYRALRGERVSDSTRARIAAAFGGMPFDELLKPIEEVIVAAVPLKAGTPAQEMAVA